MMLYAIFLVCTVGTHDCNKVYVAIPRPQGKTESDISDDDMRQRCLENNKEDHSFDAPVTNPQGEKVKITPTDCVLGNTPPADAAPANEFRGYR